jgi:3-hydroxymyristoyl/3-hydroxydecanoyl-(acyl carrier protein) dehydratase
MTSNVNATLRVPVDHPAFAGHFPGAPVLPGALLASFVLEALASQPANGLPASSPLCLDEMKFLHPVGPGAVLTITFTNNSRGVGFEVRNGGELVARGRLSQATSA